jgi:hypothetical protein
MSLYDPEIMRAVLKRHLGRARDQKEALDLYLKVGQLLYGRELGEMGREEAKLLRRAIEERFPEVRLEENAQQKVSKGVSIREITLIPERTGGGVMMIPSVASREPRRIRYANKDHLLDIIASFVMDGRMDPMTLDVVVGSSAIPYLRFAEGS